MAWTDIARAEHKPERVVRVPEAIEAPDRLAAGVQQIEDEW